MLRAIKQKIIFWREDENATAAAEFALVFPIMFTLMVAVWDLGNGILTNQKTIAASQMVVDLICREENVSDTEIAQAFQAAALALMPFDTDSLKIEVASVEYDEDDNPVALWQETSDGSDIDEDLVDRAIGLGVEGDGSVVVQVTYSYDPLFSGVLIGAIDMRERVFSRGRNSTLVTRSASD